MDVSHHYVSIQYMAHTKIIKTEVQFTSAVCNERMPRTFAAACGTVLSRAVITAGMSTVLSNGVGIRQIDRQTDTVTDRHTTLHLPRVGRYNLSS